MKDLYVSSGLFTMDLIGVICSIIAGIFVGSIFNALLGIIIFLIIPTIILAQHLVWVKALKEAKVK